jgi:hypothetical protein
MSLSLDGVLMTVQARTSRSRTSSTSKLPHLCIHTTPILHASSLQLSSLSTGPILGRAPSPSFPSMPPALPSLAAPQNRRAWRGALRAWRREGSRRRHRATTSTCSHRGIAERHTAGFCSSSVYQNMKSFSPLWKTSAVLVMRCSATSNVRSGWQVRPLAGDRS